MKYPNGFLHIVCVALMVFATLICTGGALAERSSVIRQQGLFAMELNDFSKSEAHAMELHEGDALDISVPLEKGTLHVAIKRATGGEVLFEAENPAPGTFFAVPEDDIYRVVVTGNGAQGSLRIALRVVSSGEQAAVPPYSLARIESALGYTIEYDPKLFDYLPGESVDTFFLMQDKGAALPDAMLTLTRINGKLDEIDLKDPRTTENAPSMIDWRAVRSARTLLGNGESSADRIGYLTYIELDGDTLFAVIADCTQEMDGELSQAMRDMVASLRFAE